MLLRDDLLELRKYHLLALGNDIPGFGPKLSIPEGIRVMSGLIKERVRDPRVIESECARTRKGAPRLVGDLGGVIHRVIALWRDDKPEEALAEIKVAMKRAAENPNLLCLLGRAYLRLEPPMPSKADAAFRNAHKFQCQRAELMGLWIEAKKMLGDWVGLIEVTQLADEVERTSENVTHVLKLSTSSLKTERR